MISLIIINKRNIPRYSLPPPVTHFLYYTRKQKTRDSCTQVKYNTSFWFLLICAFFLIIPTHVQTKILTFQLLGRCSAQATVWPMCHLQFFGTIWNNYYTACQQNKLKHILTCACASDLWCYITSIAFEG